ncbi:hypothetical protein L8R80_23530 [Vibrio splendidus]|uniref:hypothetical protein n=1 Tax=Vibrio splendidus TaxID=29497 RepID=UPI00246997EA|nr:hypothetical protein [Vibrio splendidus]MDH5914249.1 hypothetical protein [Vibrio splendidus]MDH5944406.1 hypothetical protein [Vibrio splendidus]MDH5987947.1 hypothetical protein [Vibrio splendidus]MDH5996178.1 hypothetical protein [Vibrio splendidus]MDH6007949.1 hypothetical protein [Vibrio splendidus]
MWKIFESDKLAIYLVIMALVFSGVIMHEVFFEKIGVLQILSVAANVATVFATVFAFWAYYRWRQAANNSEVHKLILEFAVYLQSFDLTISRLLHPSSKAQFVEDYESWTYVQRQLMEFKAKYNFLMNQSNCSFMELQLPELAYLEGRLVGMREIHIRACNDFELPASKGASLLYGFLKNDIKKNGKFNRFHLAWVSEITYQTLSFSKAVAELQQLTHR